MTRLTALLVLLPALAVAAPRTTTFDGHPAELTTPFPLTPELRTTRGPIFVHLEGILAQPRTSLDVYVVGRDGKIAARNYIGSFATMNDAPQAFGRHTLEINDFRAGRRAFTARTTVRESTQITIAIVTREGGITFERIVVTTDRSGSATATR